jgi:hypothetical protein
MSGLTIQQRSRKEWRRLGPYSKRFDRGPVGLAVDGRSFEGRFILAMQAEMLAALNDEPTIYERLLVDQAIRLKMRFDALTDKLNAVGASTASWTDHDIRTLNAVSNQYRLVLRELRMRPKVRSQRAHARSLDNFLDDMTSQTNGEAHAEASKRAPALPKPRSKRPSGKPSMRLQRPSR